MSMLRAQRLLLAYLLWQLSKPVENFRELERKVERLEHFGGAATGITDHGGLTGLGDDDHTQYFLTDGSRAMTADLNLGNNDILQCGTIKATTGFGASCGTQTEPFDEFIGRLVDLSVASSPCIQWGNGGGEDQLFDQTLNRHLFRVASNELLWIDANGVSADTINEITSANGVVVDGVKLKDSQPYCDVINEKTAATGVTIDGVLCKASEITLGGNKRIYSCDEIRTSGVTTNLAVKGSGGAYTNGIICFKVNADQYQYNTNVDVQFFAYPSTTRLFKFIDWTGSAWQNEVTFGYAQGFALLPRAAPSSPVEGSIYYDSTAKKLKFYNGSAWETVTSA